MRRSIIALLALAGLAALILGGSALYFVQHTKKIYADSAHLDIASLRKSLEQSDSIIDRNGEQLSLVGSDARLYLTIDEIPPLVRQAFISAEDQDFYQHGGFSLRGLLRSVLINLRSGRWQQGGSTITQQLARSLFLQRDKTILRKLQELAIALALEQRLSKDQILELYLNHIYLGFRSYGVGAASWRYFSRPLTSLHLAEAALLAGLPAAPSRLAPHQNLAGALRRQQFVLARMHQDGVIDEAELQEALGKEVLVKAQPGRSARQTAGYYLAAVQQQVSERFSIDLSLQNGLTVKTFMDASLQQELVQAVESYMQTLDRAEPGSELAAQGIRRDPTQVAAIVMDNQSGGILAMVGGRHFAESEFNRALAARRPLGALFMPLFYALAVERGYSLAMPLYADYLTMTGEEILASEQKSPNLYDALQGQKMEESVRLFSALGIGNVATSLENLGIQPDRRDLSMALGEVNASVAQVAKAYASLARLGTVPNLQLVSNIRRATYPALFAASDDAEGQQVWQPATAFIVTKALQDFWQRKNAGVTGLGNWAGYTAGHRSLHDAWAVGFNQNFTIAVWLGADRGGHRIAADLASATTQALALWQQVFTQLGSRLQGVGPWAPPQGIGYVRVPSSTGDAEHQFIPQRL